MNVFARRRVGRRDDAVIVLAGQAHVAAIGADGAVRAADARSRADFDRRPASASAAARRLRRSRAGRTDCRRTRRARRRPCASTCCGRRPRPASPARRPAASPSPASRGCGRRPSQSCDFESLPHVQTLPSARAATLCHVPAANDTTSVMSRDQRQAVHRLAVAELTVAAAPERVELLVLRQDQRVEQPGANLGDIAGQLRDRHLREDLDASALRDRALADRSCRRCSRDRRRS